MSGTRRLFLWVSSIAASLVVVGVVLQLYFVAAWAFGENDAIDLHSGVGNLVWLFEIIVLVAGLVAYWGAWRQVGLSAALPVLGTIQIFFVGDVDDPSENVSGWIHGFHGGLAIFVFALALAIGYRDMKALGVHGRGEATA
ncbi:MAG: hypothetical protein A2Y55_11870 [Actinobacteria bacterium RBG_16_68_12]|nr:MAG: hypothetical protein A2Y55_11870 [Actinobacteria bacterium RBG_16_68_12]